MESYLKRYRVGFRTLAPVFIGSGNKTGKKEYVYNRKKGTVMLMDDARLFEGLYRHHLVHEYEQFMIGENGGNGRSRTGLDGLFEFLAANRIPEEEYGKWAREVIEVTDPAMITHSNKEIAEFVKDGYGMPYIPGSSLKGMLRTVLETAYYMEHTEKAGATRREAEEAAPASPVRYLRDENRRLSVEAFHRQITENSKIEEMVNDIMRGVIVSDSKPLDPKVMCLAQKIDIRRDGRPHPMNVLRECIRPETDIETALTIDTTLCDYDGKYILQCFRQFYTLYVDVFMSKFANAPAIRGNSTTFFLGGGAGYPSKTVTYAIGDVTTVSRIINNTLREKLRDRHGHTKDPARGVSPSLLKCTRYGPQRLMFQMGACDITGFERIK